LNGLRPEFVCQTGTIEEQGKMIDCRTVACRAMLLEHVVKMNFRPPQAISSFGLLSDADLSQHALIAFRGFSDSTQAFQQSDHFQIWPLGRDVEWCPIVQIYWADVRPEPREEIDKFVSLVGHRVKKGRAASNVSGFNVCSSFDQQISDFDAALSSGPHETS